MKQEFPAEVLTFFVENRRNFHGRKSREDQRLTIDGGKAVQRPIAHSGRGEGKGSEGEGEWMKMGVEEKKRKIRENGEGDDNAMRKWTIRQKTL